MGKINIDQQLSQRTALDSASGKWRLVVAMLLSGIVAIVSGAYLLTA